MGNVDKNMHMLTKMEVLVKSCQSVSAHAQSRAEMGSHRLQPEGAIGFQDGLYFIGSPIPQNDRHSMQRWVYAKLRHG